MAVRRMETEHGSETSLAVIGVVRRWVMEGADAAEKETSLKQRQSRGRDV